MSTPSRSTVVHWSGNLIYIFVVRIPINIFWWYKIDSKFPGLVIWNKTTHVNGVQTACCVRGYHEAVGELHTCEREVANTVGTCCGSKDRRLIWQWAESCHAFAMNHPCSYQRWGKIVSLLCCETVYKMYWVSVIRYNFCVFYFHGLHEPQQY